MWKLYGDRNTPLELENGEWIIPSEDMYGRSFMDKGDLLWIFSEYFGKGLMYHYCIDGKRTHDHTFEAVLYDAFYERERFEILEEDLQEYSAQELEFIEVVKNYVSGKC